MKKNTFMLAITVIALAFAAPVLAERPTIDVDGIIVLDYNQVIEVPVVLEIPFVGTSLHQFNHKSPVTTLINVHGANLGRTTIDAVAVGNTGDIKSDFVTAVQGNQYGGANAAVILAGSNIPQRLEINTTAVGNTLTIKGTDVDPSYGIVGISNTIQYNEHSAVTSSIVLRHNSFPRGRDPVLNASAFGNDLNISKMSVVNSLQLNEKSPVTASIDINGNRGRFGPTTLNATAVGNSARIRTNGMGGFPPL